MKKIKKILFLFLIPALIFTFTACGGMNSTGGGNTTDADNNSAFEYGNGKDYITEHLKGDYSITYKYTVSGSPESLVATSTRTSEGYYYNYGGMEALFIKNGDKYDTYQGSAEDGFVKVDFIDPVTQKELEDEMAFNLVFGFMNQYADNTSNMKKSGTATVADRDCDKYTFSYSGIGGAVKYSYYIDKETGVCLKWNYDAAAGGQTAALTFECTEFKTSGVSLPNYI